MADTTTTAVSPLRRRMIDDMRLRNLSLATQRSYLHAVTKFSRYFGRSPDRLGLEDVRAFQVYLVPQGISWPSLNQTVCALRFFYGLTLNRGEIPERIAYRTKPEIALAEIDRIHAGGVSFGCVLADAGYGMSAPFTVGGGFMTEELIEQTREELGVEVLRMYAMAESMAHCRVVVVGYPDRVFGERACAVVEPYPDANFDMETMKAYLLDQGLSKEKLPERLEIRTALPLSPDGKILKGAVRAEIGTDPKAMGAAGA
ncbi:hypothetical protein B2G71_20810 [Novosphingobium sp. PC22D]|nr:hypothetical protein B2G71_20810 [Novosphingobium sp. PC22D]